MTKALILQYKEQLLTDYINQQHNQDECSGFIDGMEAVIKLLDQMDSGTAYIDANLIKSINNEYIEFSDGIHHFDDFTKLSRSSIWEPQQEVLRQLVDTKLLTPQR